MMEAQGRQEDFVTSANNLQFDEAREKQEFQQFYKANNMKGKFISSSEVPINLVIIIKIKNK